MAPFVGICEIVCGVLFILGLLIRFAAVTMIINMLVAIWTTKIPILLNAGFWSMVHEARTDWSMLLGVLVVFLDASNGLLDPPLRATVDHDDCALLCQERGDAEADPSRRTSD